MADFTTKEEPTAPRLAVRGRAQGGLANKESSNHEPPVCWFLQVAERTITDDLEYLIKQSVDPHKADYAVVTGVQVGIAVHLVTAQGHALIFRICSCHAVTASQNPLDILCALAPVAVTPALSCHAASSSDTPWTMMHLAPCWRTLSETCQCICSGHRACSVCPNPFPKPCKFSKTLSGVQIHNWGLELDDKSPNLEFVAPCSIYVVIRGERTYLDITSIPVRGPFSQLLRIL